MTELLQKAFDEAAKLPREEQDALASLVLDELASEARWTDAFARSQDKLTCLAEEARTEFRRGTTKPLDED
ncbi:MAG: hypothetical protein HY234_12800 [Acidobacteria bacterium]|nr:hypothetical protein [Acidobacteriota bacterium]MBI3663914.1 hypothetical protein [Acidobacteriota bacterium]